MRGTLIFRLPSSTCCHTRSIISPLSEDLHLKPTLFVRGSAELHNKVVSFFFKCRRIILPLSEDLHLKPTLFVRGTVELLNAKHNKSNIL
jgi:hypothetical protein